MKNLNENNPDWPLGISGIVQGDKYPALPRFNSFRGSGDDEPEPLTKTEIRAMLDDIAYDEMKGK